MRFNINDANSVLAFIEGQRNVIEAEVNKTVFPEILYSSLIPVDRSAPEWTRTITVRNSEAYGKADWVNGNADDINLAGNKYGESQSEIYMAGIGYGFGYEELNASAAYGVNLPNEDAIAARQASERFIDDIAFVGDKQKGMKGLINHDGVTTIAATATWLTATEDQILADVNKLIIGTATANGYQTVANTILVPYEQLAYLASTPLASKSGGTLLSFIKEHNAYTTTTGQQLIIRAMPRLKDAAAGSGDRLVAYDRSPQTVKLHLPMPHKFLPTFQTGVMNYVVGGILRVGGVDIRNTDAVRYMDGV